jgi:hypothetical protein
VIADERPALKSMLTGRIDAQHAAAHSPLWVEAIAREASHPHRSKE